MRNYTGIIAVGTEGEAGGGVVLELGSVFSPQISKLVGLEYVSAPQHLGNNATKT